jgi:hypothetical protein
LRGARPSPRRGEGFICQGGGGLDELEVVLVFVGVSGVSGVSGEGLVEGEGVIEGGVEGVEEVVLDVEVVIIFVYINITPEGAGCVVVVR